MFAKRPTAGVSGLVGEPANEPENAFAWTLLFCTAHHQVRLHTLLGAFLVMPVVRVQADGKVESLVKV